MKRKFMKIFTILKFISSIAVVVILTTTSVLANLYPANYSLLPQSIIYGYTGDLVVAEIENALSNEVAYSSFEDNTFGNWSFSAGGIQTTSNTKSITGAKYYSLTAGNITKSFSPAITKNIIVSYWSRSGVQSVNGSATAQAGRSVAIDGFTWIYYQHIVANPASITVSGTGIIDELRLYPEDAYMTTYTYKLLVGVTSICDANNMISYTEYDIFNRPAVLRDQEYKVLKKYCYNYTGQPENCFTCTDETPNWQNTVTALRCQLSGGQNTGNQEQEQKDLNPCSPTYNQLRWIQVSLNTTACPPPVNVNIRSTNSASVSGYTAAYTNVSSGQVYSFSISASTVPLRAVGTIPAGTYNLTISRTPILDELIFGSGCNGQTVTGYNASFFNIVVNPSTCNTITLDYF
jgi:hypothetical protein